MSIEIPDACTLPTAEQPLRLAEFDALFASAVRSVEPLGPTHTRMRLTGPAGLATTVRDLTARETACCSFFTFTVTPETFPVTPETFPVTAETFPVTPEPTGDGEALTLDIQVPAAYADVLAALATRATTVDR